MKKLGSIIVLIGLLAIAYGVRSCRNGHENKSRDLFPGTEGDARPLIVAQRTATGICAGSALLAIGIYLILLKKRGGPLHPMKLPITGGCICGAVRYESTAAPIMMIKCHCRDCQQVTGGPYVPAVIFPFPAFRITKGKLQHYATGHNLRGFCAECGSRLTGAENPERGIIGVTATSLDDPAIFKPTKDLFVEDAQPWDLMDETTQKFPQHFRG